MLRIIITVVSLTLCCAALTASAKPNNSGGLPALEQRVSALEDELGALVFQELNADCSADANALQEAVNTASPAGALINASGVCGPVIIHGKSNITIDGGGTTSINGDISDDLISAVYVEASRNITLRQLTASANGDDHAIVAWHANVFLYDSTYLGGSISTMDISRGTAAAIANISAESAGFAALSISDNATLVADEALNLEGTGENALAVERGGNFSQASGWLDLDGRLFGQFGAQISILSGDLTSSTVAVDMLRNSSLVLNSVDGISVSGDVRAFSSANIDLRSGGGALSLSGAVMLIQRNSSLMTNASPAADINFGFISARQNSVLDILTANYVTTPSLQLILGSGMRSAAVLTASCDASAWTSGGVTCAP